METIGERVKRLREERGWTAAFLGSRAGIGENAVYKIEAGVTKQPGFGVGVKLAKALQVSAWTIAFGGPEPGGERTDADVRLDTSYRESDEERTVTPQALDARLVSVESKAADYLLVAEHVNQLDAALQNLVNAEELPETLRDRLRESLGL